MSHNDSKSSRGLSKEEFNYIRSAISEIVCSVIIPQAEFHSHRASWRAQLTTGSPNVPKFVSVNRCSGDLQPKWYQTCGTQPAKTSSGTSIVVCVVIVVAVRADRIFVYNFSDEIVLSHGHALAIFGPSFKPEECRWRLEPGLNAWQIPRFWIGELFRWQVVLNSAGRTQVSNGRAKP